MHKFMDIVVYVLAIIGLACIVKHLMHCEEGCCLCGWHETNAEDEKSTGESSSYKIKVD